MPLIGIERDEEEGEGESTAIRANASGPVQFLSSDTGEIITSGSLFHCFFKVELANRKLYAVDLCTSWFVFLPENEPWACVAPLEEHLRRLPIREEDRAQDRQTIRSLGYHRQFLEAKAFPSSKETTVDDVIGQDDVNGLAQKSALRQLDIANQYWTNSQSTTLGRVLQIPEARFLHSF